MNSFVLNHIVNGGISDIRHEFIGPQWDDIVLDNDFDQLVEQITRPISPIEKHHSVRKSNSDN